MEKNGNRLLDKIKEILNKLTYKEIALGVIGILILFMFVWGVSDSHAFYNNSSNTIPLINATVGNFLNKTEGNIDKTSDVNLLYYMQDQNNTTTYNLVSGIPVYGFTLDSSRSNCTPNDNTVKYTIESSGRVNLEATETVPKQVVCRLFYNKNQDSDVVIYALKQDDEYGTYLYQSKRYSFISKLTSELASYKLTYKCNANDTTVSYQNNKITYTASKPDVCYVYFSK